MESGHIMLIFLTCCLQKYIDKIANSLVIIFISSDYLVSHYSYLYIFSYIQTIDITYVNSELSLYNFI